MTALRARGFRHKMKQVGIPVMCCVSPLLVREVIINGEERLL